MPRRIYWTDAKTGEPDEKREPPPYPSFNILASLIEDNTSCYVTQIMADKMVRAYDAASEEITTRYNDMLKQYKDASKRVSELETELNKWKSQQGKGRRPDQKIQAQADEIRALKAAGISNREIARRMGVSEGTIRRYLLKKE